MGLGYSAFGSQEWIRKLKPKGYFSNRKTPTCDGQNRQEHRSDYKDLVQGNLANYQTGKPVKYSPMRKLDKIGTKEIALLVAGAGVAGWIADLLFGIF